jgi:hypothetical protein
MCQVDVEALDPHHYRKLHVIIRKIADSRPLACAYALLRCRLIKIARDDLAGQIPPDLQGIKGVHGGDLEGQHQRLAKAGLRFRSKLFSRRWANQGREYVLALLSTSYLVGCPYAIVCCAVIFILEYMRLHNMSHVMQVAHYR